MKGYLLHLWKRVKLLKKLFRLIMVETILSVSRSHTVRVVQETFPHLVWSANEVIFYGCKILRRVHFVARFHFHLDAHQLFIGWLLLRDLLLNAPKEPYQTQFIHFQVTCKQKLPPVADLDDLANGVASSTTLATSAAASSTRSATSTSSTTCR